MLNKNNKSQLLEVKDVQLLNKEEAIKKILGKFL